MNEKLQTTLLSIAFTILAIFYSAFSVLAIFRLVKILREKNILSISIFFYLSLSISTITRGVSLFFLSYGYELGEMKYLLLVIPDMIYLCAFLVLIWHFLMSYSSSHIQLANDGGVFEGSDEPAINKKIQYVLSFAMPIYIISFIILVVLNYTNEIEKNKLFYINAGFNLGTPVLYVSFLMVLKFKFSGRPYKSKEATLETRDLFIVTSIWSAAKIIVGALEIFLIASGNLEKFIDNYGKETGQFLFPVLSVLFYIITEFIPDYLVLDYSMMKTFIKQNRNTSINEPLNTSESNNLFNVSKEKIGVPYLVTDINNFIIPFKAFSLTQQIYSRKKGLGIITKGTFKEQDIACREITFERISRYDQERIYEDIESIIKLNNSNICPLLGFCVQNENKIYIITSYYSNGSLFEFLHLKKLQMTYIEKIKMAILIAQGIKYLHENKIYHCHLSSCNILLEDNMNPLITDYGFENLKNNASIFNKYTNKNSYSSPEILQDAKPIGQKKSSKNTNDKIDIYSFGILLWELITETIPFDVTLSELVEYVVEKNCRPQITKEVDQKMTDLIRICWDTNPQKRPGIDNVIIKLQEKLITIQNNNTMS